MRFANVGLALLFINVRPASEPYNNVLACSIIFIFLLLLTMRFLEDLLVLQELKQC